MDICPKNWQLPRKSPDNKSWEYLFNSYNITNVSNLRDPFNQSYNLNLYEKYGFYFQAGNDRGYEDFGSSAFWSIATCGSGCTNILDIRSDVFYANNTAGRTHARSIRCVAR